MAINNIKNKQPIPIYGKGENIRDWLYVIDHARAIDTIFHRGTDGETYNIGASNEWKKIDLIHLLCRLMEEVMKRPSGTSAELITFVNDRSGHDLRYAIDATKLVNELGWQPSLKIEEGLKKTVTWYLENEQWLRHVTSGEYQTYYQTHYNENI